MRLSFSYPAWPGNLWTEEAAKGMVGQAFKAKLEENPIGIGTVLDAEVLDNGRMINLTVEWPDDPTSKRILSQNEHSL